jgi:hypothetical protein
VSRRWLSVLWAFSSVGFQFCGLSVVSFKLAALILFSPSIFFFFFFDFFFCFLFLLFFVKKCSFFIFLLWFFSFFLFLLYFFLLLTKIMNWNFYACYLFDTMENNVLQNLLFFNYFFSNTGWRRKLKIYVKKNKSDWATRNIIFSCMFLQIGSQEFIYLWGTNDKKAVVQLFYICGTIWYLGYISLHGLKHITTIYIINR